MAERWRDVNLANWEARVPIHTGPGGYDVARFDDPGHISDVVRFDLPRLGPLTGLDVVHLQCHIGTDTVSLARLGAARVAGLDFSPSALAAAQQLATRAEVEVDWVLADVYGAVHALGAARFDLVFTGIGALCWLPSVQRWAEVVAGLLRPGGRLFLREGHPVLWSLCDPRPDGLLVVEHAYFETGDGLTLSEDTSYLGEGTVAAPETVQWNHGIAEIITALQRAGLRFDSLTEHTSIPWNAFGDAMVASREHPGEFVLADRPERLALTYTLQATRAG